MAQLRKRALGVVREVASKDEVAWHVAHAYVQEGVEVDRRQKESGDMAVFCAAFDGEEAVVRVLVEAGADVNLATTDGSTPLRQARTEQIKRLLRDAGAHE